MPCVVAMDLVVSHECIFKFSREDRVFECEHELTKLRNHAEPKKW